jgi:hyperosmotically inducible protein
MKRVVAVAALGLAVEVAACTGGSTATDQPATKEDVSLVRSVRRTLVADASLSMRAKNAVVVARDGVVTLRGNVADPVERKLVVVKVSAVPGVVRVDDRLSSEE